MFFDGILTLREIETGFESLACSSPKSSSAILGVQVTLSLCRNLAKSKASSLISVSIVCLSPTFIRGISTVVSK